MRIVILLALMLAGCATSPSVRPAFQPLDTGLTRPCQARPSLPTGAAKSGLSERQAVEIIGRYDGALADCAHRHAATVRIIETRDAAIGGSAP